MMHSKFRKVVVIVGTSALFGAAGCGAASTTKTTTNATAAAGTVPQQGIPAIPSGRGRGPSAAELSTLASQLGVSTTKLQQAMKAAGPLGTPDRAATLAKQLGLSTAKVQTALQAVRPAGGPRAPQAGSAAPSSQKASA